MSGQGQGGWFDQFYEPESLIDQLEDIARRTVRALHSCGAEDLHEPFAGPDPDLEAAHDLADQLHRAVKLALLAQLRRVSLSGAAPQSVASLPWFLVEDAVESCASLVVHGAPGRDYPHHRALHLDDMSTDWTTTVGVRELANWVAHEGLTDWVAATEEEWRRRLTSRVWRPVTAEGAASLLCGRRVLGVHVEQGDQPRLEHGCEQAELCLDDGGVILLDAKDSTCVADEADIIVTISGDEEPDVPTALHGLVGARIEDAHATGLTARAVFAIALPVAGRTLVVAARGEGSSIKYWPSLVPSRPARRTAGVR